MPTATETRANFRQSLDDAEAGITVAVERGTKVSALTDAARLRRTLAMLISPDTQVYFEEPEWNAFIPAIPSISATGDSYDDVIADLVTASREYADDWNSSLKSSPNHSENWGFVQVILLSDDTELTDWLTS